MEETPLKASGAVAAQPGQPKGQEQHRQQETSRQQLKTGHLKTARRSAAEPFLRAETADVEANEAAEADGPFGTQLLCALFVFAVGLSIIRAVSAVALYASSGER